ncbi:unnamed protein product [Ranitomeya imitator]|uniref:Uncharacterized protein n=1 Tax=Ranitomeya imitator TaxID=111125 RepID=A0ABN9LRW4_9NEOB|nr:unnamed protein product [Ranitomeya imitator]
MYVRIASRIPVPGDRTPPRSQATVVQAQLHGTGGQSDVIHRSVTSPRSSDLDGLRSGRSCRGTMHG